MHNKNQWQQEYAEICITKM